MCVLCLFLVKSTSFAVIYSEKVHENPGFKLRQLFLNLMAWPHPRTCVNYYAMLHFAGIDHRVHTTVMNTRNLYSLLYKLLQKSPICAFEPKTNIQHHITVHINYYYSELIIPEHMENILTKRF